MSHFCWWNRFVANPIKNYGYLGEKRIPRVGEGTRGIFHSRDWQDNNDI